MRPAGRRRRIGAWSGVAAMALHLLVALAQIIPASAAPAIGGTAPAFLVTCVVYGQGTEKPDTDGKGRRAPDRSACPVCLAEALCHTLLPGTAMAMPVPPGLSSVRPPPPPRMVSGGRQPFRRLSRGPPSPA